VPPPTPPAPSAGRARQLPKDAQFWELRPDRLAVMTRECLLPGTRVALRLRLEGQPLSLELSVDECLVIDREGSGYVYHLHFALRELSEADRQLINLFIVKGRGAPRLER